MLYFAFYLSGGPFCLLPLLNLRVHTLESMCFLFRNPLCPTMDCIGDFRLILELSWDL